MLGVLTASLSIGACGGDAKPTAGSKTKSPELFYFIDQGQQRGLTYDGLQMLVLQSGQLEERAKEKMAT